MRLVVVVGLTVVTWLANEVDAGAKECELCQAWECGLSASVDVAVRIPNDRCLVTIPNALQGTIATFNNQSSEVHLDLTILEVADRTEWAVETRADVGTKREAGTGLADVHIVSESWIPELVEQAAEGDGLYDLSEFVAKTDWWPGVFRVLRQQLLAYDGGIYGIPMDADFVSLLVNTHLLDMGVPPPATWEAMAELIEAYAGQDLNGDGVPDYGLCYATEVMSRYIKLGMLATLVQQQGSIQGYWFSTDTFEPTLTLKIAEHIAELFPRIVTANVGAYFNVLDAGGNCIFYAGHTAKARYSDSSENDVMLAFRAPGSKRVYDRDLDEFVDCDELRCPYARRVAVSRTSRDPETGQVTVASEFALVNHAPILNANWNLAISKHASPEAVVAAMKFIDYVQSDDPFAFMLASGCFDPWTQAQFTGEYQAHTSANARYLAAKSNLTAETLNDENAALPLRVTGATDYEDAFEEAMAKAVTGEYTPAQAYAEVREKFSQITADQNSLFADDGWQLNLYRKSLGLSALDLTAVSSDSKKSGLPGAAILGILLVGGAGVLIAGVWINKKQHAHFGVLWFINIVTAPECHYLTHFTLTLADVLSDVFAYVWVVRIDHNASSTFKYSYLAFTTLAVGMALLAIGPLVFRLTNLFLPKVTAKVIVPVVKRFERRPSALSSTGGSSHKVVNNADVIPLSGPDDGDGNDDDDDGGAKKALPPPPPNASSKEPTDDTTTTQKAPPQRAPSIEQRPRRPSAAGSEFGEGRGRRPSAAGSEVGEGRMRRPSEYGEGRMRRPSMACSSSVHASVGLMPRFQRSMSQDETSAVERLEEQLQKAETVSLFGLFFFEDVPIMILNIIYIMAVNNGKMRFTTPFIVASSLTQIMLGVKLHTLLTLNAESEAAAAADAFAATAMSKLNAFSSSRRPTSPRK